MAPERVISGDDTGLSTPADVKVNAAGDIFAANYGTDTITEYAPGASGNASPICTLGGLDTDLNEIDDMSLEANGTLVIGDIQDPNGEGGAVLVFPPGSCGDVAPSEYIVGASTGFHTVDGVGTDAQGTIFADSSTSSAVEVFKAGATGNVAPEYTITGADTGLGYPDDVVVGFDGKLYVTSGFGGPIDSVTVYAAGAKGNAKPVADITGSNTDFGNVDDLAVDTAGDIFTTDASAAVGPAVLGWKSGATGDVAPNVVISGSRTTFYEPEGVFVAGPPSSVTMRTAAAATGIKLGASTSDTATLSGGSVAPTGSLLFRLFGPGDPACSKNPAYTSPALTVKGDSKYTSPSFTPKDAGTYSWQAEYSGDAHNAAITSSCGDPADTVAVGVPPTTVSTELVYGDGQTGTSISVPAGSDVFDQASLSGENVARASGTITYNVYSDAACAILSDGGSPQDVSEGDVPESQAVTLSTPGTYYWQAVYSGDSGSAGSSSTCGPKGEVETVRPGTTPITITTSLSGGGQSGNAIKVPAGTAVIDSVTASGDAASSATGAVTFNVYSNASCTTPVSAGTAEPILNPGTFPSSQIVTLTTGGTYYWQASYTGDATNAAAVSKCGSEVETVTKTTAATAVTTTLSGDSQSGAKITVPASQPATDSATLSGKDAATATGTVTYRVYSDKACTTLVITAGTESVSKGKGKASPARTLPAGTYYWTASYSGDARDQASVSGCGSEVLTVKKPAGRPGTAPYIDTVTTAWSKSAATARVSTNVAGDLVVAFVAANGPKNARQTATVSGGGLTWYRVSRDNPVGSDTEVWVALPSGKLSDAAVTVTGGIKGYDEVLMAVAFKNAAGVGPESFVSAASGAPEATLTTPAKNAWVFAIGADWRKYQARSAGTGQLVISQVNAPGGATVWLQATGLVTAEAGTKVTINDKKPTNDPYDLLLVAIQ